MMEQVSAETMMEMLKAAKALMDGEALVKKTWKAVCLIEDELLLKELDADFDDFLRSMAEEQRALDEEKNQRHREFWVEMKRRCATLGFIKEEEKSDAVLKIEYGCLFKQILKHDDEQEDDI